MSVIHTFTVVSEVLFGGTSLSVALRSSVGELSLVIESTSLVASVEISLHTVSIVGEFVNPSLLRGKERVPVGQKLGRKFGEFVETLERMSWWDLNFLLFLRKTFLDY